MSKSFARLGKDPDLIAYKNHKIKESQEKLTGME